MLPQRLNSAKPIVLVVDDSSEMRRYLRVLLETESYLVETASSGREALDHVRRGSRPDVVLLDIQMPGMNGLSTLRHLLKLVPGLKVIMCSGVEDSRKIQRASSLGAQAFISKPVQPLYLSAAIERCLGGVEAGDTSTPIPIAPN